jgi:hypothetical protein
MTLELSLRTSCSRVFEGPLWYDKPPTRYLIITMPARFDHTPEFPILSRFTSGIAKFPGYILT